MRYLSLSACIFLLPVLSLAQETDSSYSDISTSVEAGRYAVAPVVPESDIIPKVEVMPEFPGGQNALGQYLGRNIQYPADAVAQDIQGQVLVQFVVCEDGSLCNEEFLRELGGGCEQEVLRVLRSMPAWKPGLVNGKPVKTYFRLPVTFRLEEEVEEPKE